MACLTAMQGSVARADDRPAGHKSQTAAEQAHSQKVLRQAVAEFELGNWTEARALFEQVHEVSPSARTLRAIGLCSFEEKHYVEALRYLTSALDDQRKPLTDDERHKLTEVIARARSFVASYELVLSPAHAKVSVDERAAVMLDSKLLLDPGVHELAVSAEGYRDHRRRIEAQPRDHGKLQVSLESNVAVELPMAVATPPAQRPATSVAVAPGPTPSRRDDQGGRRTLAWAALASSGVIAITGGVLLGLGLKDAASVTDASNGTRWEEIEGAHDRAGPLQTAGIVALGVGGVGIVLSSVWLAVGRRKSVDSTRAQLGLGPNGLVLRGRL
ncbi:MAG: hypothetical protein QM778_35150 [Myxococcales bacterium]